MSKWACDCGRRPREFHRDGCSELRFYYLRWARDTVRWLVPILTARPGIDEHNTARLRQAAQLLATVQTPMRHPGRVAEAGRVLFQVRGDVTAAYLGARLVLIGQHLTWRRPAGAADMDAVRDANVLTFQIAAERVPNHPSAAQLPCCWCWQVTDLLHHCERAPGSHAIAARRSGPVSAGGEHDPR